MDRCRPTFPTRRLTTRTGRKVPFAVDPFLKHCLVKGVDEPGYILEQSPAIGAYEAAHPASINAPEHGPGVLADAGSWREVRCETGGIPSVPDPSPGVFTV
jgi:hypothetical protein